MAIREESSHELVDETAPDTCSRECWLDVDGADLCVESGKTARAVLTGESDDLPVLSHGNQLMDVGVPHLSDSLRSSIRIE